MQFCREALRFEKRSSGKSLISLFMLPKDNFICNCFFVNQGERWERCFYSEILFIEASGCYCYIYRRDKPRLSVARPLLLLEPFLPAEMFRRVHRSHIVNLCEVDGIIGNTVCIDKHVIAVSRPYREDVFGCFEFLNIKRQKE